MKFTTVLVATFAGLAAASPVASEESLDKRYTDWPGCMTTCNTPSCAIKDCYNWCKKICCRTYPSYPSC
ncbi:hypothetical protein IF2G_01615 [Cordyceps javanica]|nr:hypothetical protein IF2G_01615 [Cordyceps javanica]